MTWQSAFGLVAFTVLAWALGGRRRLGFRSGELWRTAAAGLGLQLLLAALLLKVPAVRDAFLLLNRAVGALQAATEAGTAFVFGYLGGGPLPFAETHPGASFVLAFQALPLILVMSALSALLYHWRVLPAVVQAFAWLLRRSLGVGGAVGVATAANIFVGMVEAPLFVRPYLARLSRGEMFIVMTSGMATIAGTVMVLYATFLAGVVPDALGHILTASLISAPAAILVGRLMEPDGGDGGEEARLPPSTAQGAMDAVTRGTVEGVGLLINVIAMLVVLVALVHLFNQVLALLPSVAGAPLSLQRIFGWAFAPVVWLMGVPWTEAAAGGALMGIKTVLNELLAYLEMARAPEPLSPRSRLILTYAMCGFANFGSLGIMIGGLAGMVPERRAEIAALGMKSIVAGTIATCMTGAVVGVLT